MTEPISVKTTRYSALFRRILQGYGAGAEIRIDRSTYTEADVPELLDSWCTNRRIGETHNFWLKREGVTLFGFEAHPENLVIAASERAFVERLAAERVVRIVRPRPGRTPGVWEERIACTGCLVVAVLLLGAVGWLIAWVARSIWRGLIG